MAFFYNLFITVAFVVCALLFLLAYQQRGLRALLWVSVMFILFTFDNLLLYMDELMPGFAALAAENRGLYLTASNVSGILITFAYDRIVRCNRNEGPHPVPWPFWGSFAVIYVVLGILGTASWASTLTLILRGLLPIVVIVVEMRPEEGDYETPVIPSAAIQVLLAFQIANTVEMAVAFFGFELMPGRFVTIEAMSIACIAWGIAYCLGVFGGKDAEEVQPGVPTDEGRLRAVCQRYALTGRECEILALLYEGCTNHEIAERSFISEGTVKTHVHNIFQKTGCANRVQLLRLVADAESER